MNNELIRKMQAELLILRIRLRVGSIYPESYMYHRDKILNAIRLERRYLRQEQLSREDAAARHGGT